MKISRHGIVERPNNLPHISGVVVHGDTVYLQGVTPDPGGDITSQTRQVLERIDTLLAMVREKIFDRLPDETWVYPGHGNDTSLGAERPSLPEWEARRW